MVARDINAVPLIAIDRVVDDVMRSAVGVDQGDTVTTVGVNQIIDDQSAWVTARDSDAAVARTAAVAEYSIELDVDVPVLIVAAEQGNSLAAGSGDGEASDRDELGLLKADGMISCASAGDTRQNHLARLRGRVGFDDDSVDLGGSLEIVFPGNRYLFGVSAGLDVNHGAGTGCVDGGLNCREAGTLTAAGGVCAVDI